MTLDQSLANLQAQADRLANLFASTADAIEARTGTAAKTVAESFHAVGQAALLEVRQDTPAGVVAATDGSLLNFEGENYVPQRAPEVIYNPETGEHKHWAMAQSETPQGAAPSSATSPAVPAASAVEVEGQGAATPEAPRPAAPTGETPPWVTQAAEEPTAEKKSGRRTNEEIAAELGVDLDAVKEWKGGGRVSRKDMEEYKKIAASQAMNNQTLPEAAGVTTPPDGSHLPTQASNPFGNPGTPAPVAPPQPTPAPAEQVPWATAEPVQPPAQQQPEFGTWPAADGVNPSNPFGS